MSKVGLIKLLTYTIIIVVVLLQIIWGVNVYRATERQLIVEVDDILEVSISQELIIRSETALASVLERSEPGEEISFMVYEDEEGTFDRFNVATQEWAFGVGYPISLYAVDTIFTNMSAKTDFRYRHIVNRIDINTGEILETTDTINQGIVPRALVSSTIPIRMGRSEGVQVLIIAPYRIILGRMIIILLSSFFLLLFIASAVFFLLRSYAREKKLRQTQVDFSNALIHDMKTPLSTMATINSLLQSEKIATDPEKRNQMLDVSQKQITNLQALTDRILTIARSEESKLEPIWENLDIPAIIQQLVGKFTVQTIKDVHFTTRFAPAKIEFVADHTLLNNAVSNLIDNAIKYSDKSVQIDIDCELNEMGLYIKIKDNGYGISKKDQKVIFAKFERGVAVTRQEAKGFGLGLAYVKSVAEALGGTVDMFSIQSEGATFGLFIPHRKDESIQQKM